MSLVPSSPWFLSQDLLPPSGLHVLRVEESELEIRWDQPDPSPVPVTGFAITYAPLAAPAGGGGVRGGRQTDFLDRQQSSHLLQDLIPGELYNISTFSIKRNANSNDISQPAVALIRTRESRARVGFESGRIKEWDGCY